MSDKFEDMFDRILEAAGQERDRVMLNQEALARLRAEIEGQAYEAGRKARANVKKNAGVKAKGLTAEDLEYLSYLEKGR